MNFVERLGLDFLLKWVDRTDPRIRKWSPSELQNIQWLERWTVAVAALTGAVTGTILGGLEIWLSGELIDAPNANGWREQLPYWSIYLAVVVVVSGGEILFLYWLVLRLVARITSLAGIRLSTEEIEQVIALGLSRAALELPNPREPIFGIDPYARVPRWKLVAYAILYRLKIGLTSFVLRVLLRRVLARAAVRFFIPLVSIPVFSVWNGIIIHWVMREVRVRVAGPVVVEELVNLVAAQGKHLSEGARRLMLEMVGEAIIRGADGHPNYVLLLERLSRELDVSPASINVDWESSRRSLREESREAQQLLLVTLTVTALLNGQLRRAQRELLVDAYRLCGVVVDLQGLVDLRREFLRGQGIDGEALKRIGAFASN